MEKGSYNWTVWSGRFPLVFIRLNVMVLAAATPFICLHLLLLTFQTNLMVCGVDVYHDKNASRSVGALVCAMNTSCTRWYSRTCEQMRGQEMLDALKPCFIAGIRKFAECNQRPPDRIILFRDGVGDGQLGSVAKHEARQLEECFAHFAADYRPKLTVVVVQKRINQRILTQEVSLLLTFAVVVSFVLICPSITGSQPGQPATRHHRGPHHHSCVMVWFLFGVSTCAPGHRESHPLCRRAWPQRLGMRPDPETVVHADAFVLQLARHRACACPMSVCPQAGPASGPEHPQALCPSLGWPSLLPLKSWLSGCS